MLHGRDVEAGVQPRVSTGRSIHAVPSITPSLREGIEDGPKPTRRPRSHPASALPGAGPHGAVQPHVAFGRWRRVSFSKATAPSGTVEAMASYASTVIAILITPRPA